MIFILFLWYNVVIGVILMLLVFGRRNEMNNVKFLRLLKENSKEAIAVIKNKFKELEKKAFMDTSFDSGLSNSEAKLSSIEEAFGSLPVAASNLTEIIQYTDITDDEMSGLDNLDFNVEKVALKDITRTKHGLYTGPIGVILCELARFKNLISNLKTNPGYYSEDLKDYEKQKAANDPIRIYFKEDENGVEKGTIEGGNNRIVYMKLLYARDMQYAKTDSEKAAVDEKYTFYAHTKRVSDLEKGKSR